ncbi:MAG: hypothetical protein NC311_01560 [Muribaculaceae bacterium]|nr:hypothetical protein [Muribaculaceae bacterium]
MRKQAVLLLTIILIATNAMAKQELKHGSDNSCYYISGYGKKSTGNNWAYYFCGASATKCDGKTHKGHDLMKVQYHGEGFSWNGRNFWCCNDTAGTAGHYEEGDKWIVHDDPKTKSVGNGTCEQRIQKTICGDEITVDCDSPGTCNSGHVMRNGECAAECPDGQAYESATSNKCIDCKTTNYQGIKTNTPDGHKICMKCENNARFFDRKSQTCVGKDKYKQIPGWAMKKCFACPNSEYFKQCVEIVQEPSEQLLFEPGNKTTLKLCHVDESSLDSLMK